jgi:cold shock CspA family protein
MSADYFYSPAPKSRMTLPNKLSRPKDLRGKPETGRIVRILTGQGHGYIRLRNEREVYFHRADLRDNTTFNSFQIGDVVTFELLEDTVSGPRALRVARDERTR